MAKKTDPQDKWDLTIFFKNDGDPEIDKLRVIVVEKAYEFINKWKDRDDYLKDPEILKDALEEYEEWSVKYGIYEKEGSYFWLKSMLDQSNPEIKARINKITELSQRIENDLQFFFIRISKIDEKLHSKFLKSPALKQYKHFLKKIFEESKHLLTEDQEKIMNLKGKVSHTNWVKMTEGFLTKEERVVLNDKGKKEKLSFTEIMNLIDDRNKKIRDTAVDALNDILKQFIEVGENEINSILENKRVNDELRKYTRPDEPRHLSDDMDTEVVDALTQAVTKKFDTAKRFYKLKAKLLGFKKLQYHERNLAYGETDKEYSFDEAKELVGKVFRDLDPKFIEIYQNFFNQRRVDVYPQKGKHSGAFCTSSSKDQPIFILLNYTNKLNDVRVLAHEMGHGIHHTLANKQNPINVGSTTSTAEVASTFMEDFVFQELIKSADDELRLALMVMKLGDEIATIHRQVAIYNFEFELHKVFREKGYISKEEIGKLFLKNMEAYMGDYVEQNPGSENWWLYISHIRSFFYVYSYASGLLISKSLQHYVKEEPAFISKVIEFLEAGSSESPKSIFKKMGVDISDRNFWDKGLEEIDEMLIETEKLAKKLGKI